MRLFCLLVFSASLFAGCKECRDLAVICPEPDVLGFIVGPNETCLIEDKSLDPEISWEGEYEPEISYALNGATSGSGSSLEGVVFNEGSTTVNWVIKCGNDEHICQQIIEVELDLDRAEGEWVSRAPLPEKAACLGACALGNHIYAFGGGASKYGRMEGAWRYDPVRDEWSVLGPMGKARWMVAVAACLDRIYVCGGGWPEAYLKLVEVYDPSNGNWSTVAPMPTARAMAAAVSCGDRIYVMGGIMEEEGQMVDLRTLEMYDPETGNWESKADMKYERWGLAAVTLEDKIYAIGGGGAYQDRFERYDPVNDSWEELPPLPFACFALAATTWKGHIVVSGGTATPIALGSKFVWIYDPEHSFWYKLDEMTLPRQWHASVCLGDSIYVLAGEERCIFNAPNAEVYNSMEALVLKQ